jgi:hypothetical protein
MARRRRSSHAIVRTVRAPAPIIRVAAPSAPRFHRTRRVGRRVVGAVGSEKHTLTAVAAAIGFGMLEKSGTKIPSIGPLGPAATVGIAAWVYGRMSKSPTAAHVATGLLCVALNRWAATGVIAGEDVLGEGHGVTFDE